MLSLVPMFCVVASGSAEDFSAYPVSPVVSYQFSEDYTADSAQSQLVSFQFLDTQVGDPNSPIVSPAISYHFYDPLNEDTLSRIVSPTVSYQYFDWPGDDILRVQSSP